MAVTSEALTRSKRLRVPRFEPTLGIRSRITMLEDYTLESAFTQGELSEERLDALEALKELRHRWDHLAGWETYRRTRTEKGVDDAKRQVDPGLYDQITDLEWHVKRFSEEIDRLERDATKISRVYTMITGS